MTDSILPKLEQLDDSWREVRKRFYTTATELKTIKAKPTVDIAELNQLKLQLAELKNGQRGEQKKLDDLKQSLQEIEADYEALEADHQTLIEQHEQLQHAHEQLKQTNNKLQEKNRLALEHTKVVLERLTKIDKS